MSETEPIAAHRRVTIKDVARRAGVGTMTVSRVLNSSGYVTDRMREKVEEAIQELAYVPNHLARGLRSRRSGTLALILTDVTNPFFTTVARGAEDAASDEGSLVLFCNTDESEEEEIRYMRMLVEKQVDGVVLVPATSGHEAVEMARKNGIEVVVIDRAIEDKSVDVVRCDAVDGSFQLGQHLLKLGHRRFAILAGRPGVSTSDDRIQGFLNAVQTTSEVEIFHGDFSLEGGSKAAKQALESKTSPTAMFAVNNFIAFGALREAKRAGLRIPEDIALVAFDDLPVSLVTEPFLTVANQPAYDMGFTAVKRLLERITSQKPLDPVETILPVSLTLRRSSGEPRNG